MKNNRVLYIGGFDLPDRNAAALRVINVAKILREIGYNVVLKGLGNKEVSFVHDGFQCSNVKYPDSITRWLQYLFSINWYSDDIDLFKPSIVIAYNHPSWALNRLRKYCHKRGVLIISDCTEWYTPEGSLLYCLAKGLDTHNRMLRVHPKLDGIISISRYLHDFYTHLGANSIMLPPLVDITDPKWTIKPEITDDQSLKLVYAGSPGHKDRLDSIVRAISQPTKRPLIFTIFGISKDQFVQLYSYNEQIPDYVVFRGHVSHDEVLAELKKADFQIFVRDNTLTTRAGFPTKFVESLSVGIPVLTNLTSNIGDYLSNGKNGYVLDATSDQTLHSSIEKVLNLSNKEIEVVKASIDRTTFDFRNYVISMISFLDTLLNKEFRD